MSLKSPITATLLSLTTSLGLASAAMAASAWTSQDDLEYVYSFSQAYAARTGFLPDPALVQASLTCVRGTYNQLAALGSDPVAAIQYAATTCQSQFVGQGTANSSNSAGTLFNSSGDSSLSTDSNGCMYYSGSSFSNNYSFSTC